MTSSNHSQLPDSADPRFEVKDQVRVRKGTPDPDFSDFPLGGWCGEIEEVDDCEPEPVYLVKWNKATLKAAHPVYRRRCEREGLDFDSTWLNESALEPDDGKPVVLEQPTQLVPRPLDLTDPEDRARSIFGLTSDDPLPKMDSETLACFLAHLEKHLRFPFRGSIVPDDPYEKDQKVSVQRILLPSTQPELPPGLVMEVVLKGEKESRFVPLYSLLLSPQLRGYRELEAYEAWVEVQDDEWEKQEDFDDEDSPEGPYDVSSFNGQQSLPLLAQGLVVLGAMGGLLGALYTTQEGAGQFLQIAGLIVALLGLLIGGGVPFFLSRSRWRFALMLLGGLAGFALGGGIGLSLGALAYTFVGTIPGAIVGNLLDWGLRALKWHRLMSLVTISLCTTLGGLAYVFVMCQPDYWPAVIGMARGALAGVLLPPVLMVLFAIGFSFLYSRNA